MSEPIMTEVRKSSLGGRGLFATKPCQTGDVLLSLDRPLIAVLDKPRIEDTCSWCFSWTELPVLSGAGINQATKVNWCTGCKKVKYCSKQCQSRAWRAVHKRECKDLSKESELIPSTVHAVIQMMQGLSAGEKRYQPILEMEAHRDEFEEVKGARLQSMQLMVKAATAFMSDRGVKVQAESAMMAMCVLMCNSSRLVTPTFDPLGLVLDPQAAMINHSCTPNAVIVFDGPRMSVRALDAIYTGKEVLISYIDSTAPYGVRQAELQDQYFFTCGCDKCKLGLKAPQDAFLEPGSEFEERIAVIDDMIPEITKDPAWPQHVLGESTHERRLSALQFYGYSYLSSPGSEEMPKEPAHFRKAIRIVRNTGVWPITRAPMPALYHQYAVACLYAKRYNEALIAMIRLNLLIDPVVYPQKHHPVRVVHSWTLATLAKAIGSDPDAPFCKALQSCGVDLSMLFLALVFDIRGQIELSHGADSHFAQSIVGVLGSLMEPGGDLDTQFAQQGVKRDQWPKLLEQQIKDMWPRLEAFAKDEAMAAQIDKALAM